MMNDPFDMSNIPTPEQRRRGVSPEKLREECIELLGHVDDAFRDSRETDHIPIANPGSELARERVNALLSEKGWEIEYAPFGGQWVLKALC